MEIYQFVKYNPALRFEKLLDSGSGSLTYCFDFEDSIQDVINPENTPQIKAGFRKVFEAIITGNRDHFEDFTPGIRLNAIHSGEQESDMNCLKRVSRSIKIKSVLLPKTESYNDILNIQSLLRKNKIVFSEIIPIIETKTGFHNLQAIAEHPLITKIAFGHCDFNLSCDCFPFFHQDSEEYWNWVSQILTAVSGKKLLFLNSAYLRLNDENGFKNMLKRLSRMTGNHFGQFTLTYNQTKICLAFYDGIPVYPSENPANHPVDVKKYAGRIVQEMESCNSGKGFAVSDRSNEILSPQEYLAAKKYLSVL